jgi:hypothetical protein
MLFGLAVYGLGGTPYVSARGDGIVRRVQIEEAEAVGEKSPERLARENPRPKYDRGLPTNDISEEAAQKQAKGDSYNAQAQAAAPDAPGLGAGRKIDYVAIGQSVEQVMRELGQSAGLRVVAGGPISGNVKKRHFKGEFTPLMDKLAQEYGVFWFADGGVVYVDGLEDQKTKIVKLKNVSKEQVYEAMDMAGMGRAKSRVIVAAGEGNARVTGPESFQRSMENLLAGLEPSESPDIKIIKYGTRIN